MLACLTLLVCRLRDLDLMLDPVRIPLPSFTSCADADRRHLICADCGQYSEDCSFYYVANQDFTITIYDTQRAGETKKGSVLDEDPRAMGGRRGMRQSLQEREQTSMKVLKKIRGREGRFVTFISYKSHADAHSRSFGQMDHHRCQSLA